MVATCIYAQPDCIQYIIGRVSPAFIVVDSYASAAFVMVSLSLSRVRVTRITNQWRYITYPPQSVSREEFYAKMKQVAMEDSTSPGAEKK